MHAWQVSSLVAAMAGDRTAGEARPAAFLESVGVSRLRVCAAKSREALDSLNMGLSTLCINTYASSHYFTAPSTGRPMSQRNVTRS
jgi:hypothetical protein